MSAYSAIIGEDHISFNIGGNPVYSGQLSPIPQVISNNRKADL